VTEKKLDARTLTNISTSCKFYIIGFRSDFLSDALCVELERNFGFFCIGLASYRSRSQYEASSGREGRGEDSEFRELWKLVPWLSILWNVNRSINYYKEERVAENFEPIRLIEMLEIKICTYFPIPSPLNLDFSTQ